MLQTRKHVRSVLQAALACGMFVQILLGLVWLMKNMGGLQPFQESMVLLAGEGDSASGYSGVLYRGLAGLLSSHLWILYGIQLAAALAAAYGITGCFLKTESRVLRLLAVMALLTIPQALQCHLAVLPWSLGTSLLMGETALWLKQCGSVRRMQAAEGCLEKKQERLMAGMLGGWLLMLLILPVYAWFILPLLFAALWQTGKKKAEKSRAVRILAVLLLCLGTVTVNCGWNPTQWNRQLAADALSRWGWPYFQDNYEAIPSPLHEEIGLVTAREVSAYADGVERVLIPKLEAQYGTEQTTALLWKLAGICLRENLKTDMKNVIWDLAAYHATPAILPMQLRGRAYDAFSGINYEQMKNRSPLLTRYYVTYGGRWWWMMLALAAMIRLCQCRNRRDGGQPQDGEASSDHKLPPEQKEMRRRIREFICRWLPVGISGEWMILSCVFAGSGIMDYKKTVWVTILWYLLALGRLGDTEGRTE